MIKSEILLNIVHFFCKTFRMAQSKRRHWSVFLGIWSLAAVAPVVLFIPIFGRTLLSGKIPFSVRKFRSLLEADLMVACIAGVFLVALVQSFYPKARNAVGVILPQLAVWVALGLALSYVAIFKPLPPPLVARLGDVQLAVPYSFRPESSSRYVVAEGRQFPIFKFSVCRGTVDPPLDQDCEASLVQVNVDPDIGRVFSGLAPDTAYEAYLAKSGIGSQNGPALADNPSGALRVIKMARGTSDADAWVTLDATNAIVRFASCGWSDGCLVTAENSLGFISYRVNPEAAQSLVAREAEESALLDLIVSWQK